MALKRLDSKSCIHDVGQGGFLTVISPIFDIPRYVPIIEKGQVDQKVNEGTYQFINPISRLFQTLKSMSKKRELDSLKPKVSSNQ